MGRPLPPFPLVVRGSILKPYCDDAIFSETLHEGLPMGIRPVSGFVVALLMILTSWSQAQKPDTASRLDDFDAFAQQTLKDWNAPGFGVGVVSHGNLIFAHGYGFRDFGKKLPFTPETLCPI